MSKNFEERRRLAAHRQRQANWKKWGPYLSERAWGTVREDYSERAKRGNILRTTKRAARLTVGMKMASGHFGSPPAHLLCLRLLECQDPILKERFFGLTNKEGNHGEDVKEYYFYLDSTPTHSYMKMLYKYPQMAFPYDQLVAENQKRALKDPEYELCDTGVFDGGAILTCLSNTPKRMRQIS